MVTNIYCFDLTLRRGALAVVLLTLGACSGADARKVNYLEKGQSYYNEQNYDKARVELRNALQIDPKFADARYLSGRVAEKRSELREAVSQYQLALDENPKHAAARAAMARIYLLGGLIDKAKEQVDLGLVDNPGNAALITVRAGIAAREGNIAEAMKDAEAAFQLDKNDEYTIALLASLYKQSGMIDKAVKVIAEGIERSPKNIDLRVVNADLESARGNYSAVEQLLKEIIQIEPKSMTHRARLVKYYLFRKDIQGAEAALRQAIKDLPDQQEPKLVLIDFLWNQQGEAVASKEIDAMLSTAPSNVLKLQIGSYLESRQQHDRAQKLYESVIQDAKLGADGLSARNRLAALLLKQKNNERAATLVAEVLKENERDNDALILRAEMAMQKGDLPTAITDLRGVLRDQPNSTPVLRALAKAHLLNNEVSLAEETLRSALQANPADLTVRKELVRLLLQQNKADQAAPLLENLSKADSISVDNEVLDLQFKTQMMTKDYSAAQATAEKLQVQSPSLALGWYYAGMVAEVRQDREGARKQYQVALDKQPDGAEPLSGLVRLDIADKQNAKALDRLNKVLEQNPKHTVALNLRGELLLAGKQWQPAMDSFSKAIELAPAWWIPYRGLALAQLGNNKADQAVATYKMGVEKTRSNALAAELAALHERLKQPDESIRVYQQWLQREPKSIAAANNLAMLLLNYRSDKDSLAQAQKLGEQLAGSGEPTVLDTRGWIKYRSGDYQGAVNLLQQAANTSVGSASALVRYHLGMAQWKSGNTTAAREQLEVALKQNAEFPGAEEARQTLEQLKKSG